MPKKRRRRPRFPLLTMLSVVALCAAAGALAAGILHGPEPTTMPSSRASTVATPAAAETPAPEQPNRPTPVALPAASTVAAPVSASPEPLEAERAAPAAARLAIVIDDCGQAPEIERGFIALPIPLTISVLPKVRYASTIADEAAGAGKGVMLHLPMEPLSGIDPGPGRVTTSMSDSAIEAAVREDLAAVPHAQGVNNHEGSRATADARVMSDVAAVLAAEHRFFIDSRTNKATVAAQTSSEHGIPVASRDVFLDDVADEAATVAQLQRAAAIARERGSAIAIGHPRPTTLAALRANYAQLSAAGITFVAAADLVR